MNYKKQVTIFEDESYRSKRPNKLLVKGRILHIEEITE